MPFKNFDEILKAFCEKQLLLQATNASPVIIGNVQHFEKNDLNYIYFESTGDNATKGLKRYHQIVATYMLFDVVYRDSNIIDIQCSYTIDELQKKFKNYLLNLLNKLD